MFISRSMPVMPSELQSQLALIKMMLEKYSIRLSNFVDGEDYYIQNAVIHESDGYLRTGMVLVDRDGDKSVTSTYFSFNSFRVVSRELKPRPDSMKMPLWESNKAILQSLSKERITMHMADYLSRFDEDQIPQWLSNVGVKELRKCEGVGQIEFEPCDKLLLSNVRIDQDNGELILTYVRTH